MILSGFVKELKKLLRRKKRWLALGVWLLLLGITITAGWYADSKDPKHLSTGDAVRSTLEASTSPVFNFDQTPSDDEIQSAMLERIKEDGHRHPVVLRTQYVCGERVEQLGELDGQAVFNLHEGHPDALIDIADDGVVSFTELVNDLSPECRDNAFFGLDESGNLTLFNGQPEEDRVIKTFFQLNIQYLESSLPRDTVDQLHRGIRVTDLEEYNSVLSTFSDYAIDETEQVMKRHGG
jgi:forespore regulator of the sigma-K checkpoint